jgi:uncharacterized protein YjbJ (UPF0337 family)
LTAVGGPCRQRHPIDGCPTRRYRRGSSPHVGCGASSDTPQTTRRCAELRRKLRRYRFIISTEKSAMDWNRVEGNWKQFKGKVKEKWGRLTDDDLDVIAGHRDQLEGKIQERYGVAKDQVRKDIADWYNAQKW